jgi:hypothetical protein
MPVETFKSLLSFGIRFTSHTILRANGCFTPAFISMFALFSFIIHNYDTLLIMDDSPTLLPVIQKKVIDWFGPLTTSHKNSSGDYHDAKEWLRHIDVDMEQYIPLWLDILKP